MKLPRVPLMGQDGKSRNEPVIIKVRYYYIHWVLQLYTSYLYLNSIWLSLNLTNVYVFRDPSYRFYLSPVRGVALCILRSSLQGLCTSHMFFPGERKSGSFRPLCRACWLPRCTFGIALPYRRMLLSILFVPWCYEDSASTDLRHSLGLSWCMG